MRPRQNLLKTAGPTNKNLLKLKKTTPLKFPVSVGFFNVQFLDDQLGESHFESRPITTLSDITHHMRWCRGTG